MSYKKYLSPKGAEALRAYASKIPITINNIVDDTEEYINVYQSVADDLGYHSENFGDLLRIVKDAVINAADAISALPSGLNESANKIDKWCSKNPSINIAGN